MSERQATTARTWTLILSDSAGGVWIAQTEVIGPAATPAEKPVWSASLWSHLDSTPDARDLTLRVALDEKTGHDLPPVMQWSLERQGAVLASGEGVARWNRRHRVARIRGAARSSLPGAHPATQFELIGDVPLPQDPVVDPVPRGAVIVTTPGVVSLRIDDCNGADADAFRVLRELHLTAAMGVPSGRINREGYCSQALLEAMVRDGDRVESHSRVHGQAPKSFGGFYLEVVGSAQDLRARGFIPSVFIPPGTWRRGPTLMDGAAKLIGPYADLLRRTYVSTESYALPPYVSLPAPGRDGPSSLPLKAVTPAMLEARVRRAAADSQWIGFMWHSWDMPLEDLRARLRVIAALRDSGLVTVLPYFSALHAGRN
jgi:hypothetical protein